MQTSTVTVAVFEVVEQAVWLLQDRDIAVFTTKDSGPGGQHRNKTESCVVMRHLPTGIEVKSALKSQHQNRRLARDMLEARVKARVDQEKASETAAKRREMVGSGMRADKIRTYREQDDSVTDHRSDRKARLSVVRAGQLDRLLMA